MSIFDRFNEPSFSYKSKQRTDQIWGLHMNINELFEDISN